MAKYFITHYSIVNFYRNLIKKLAIGVEPITFGLQNRYSTDWVKQAGKHK